MKKTMKTFAAMAIVAIAAAVTMAACKKEEPTPVPVISITTQPASPAALTEGSISGSLTVAASVTEGAALSYQWYTNTTASSTGGTAISGATGASYTLPTDLAAGTYYYFCEINAEREALVRTEVATVTVTPQEVDNTRLIGKWEVGDNSLGIVSVEFGGSNNYIVVTNTELNTRAEDDEYISYFGTYTVDGDEVALSDLGTLTVTSLEGDDIAFSLATDSGSAVSMNGGKAQEMASTSKTDLLCRTWRVVSFYPEEEMEDEEDVPEFVYFSKAGTYLVSYTDGSSMLANWKWKSESDGTFYYAHEHPPVWDDDYSVIIEKLDANSLDINEPMDGEDYITFMEAVE